MTTSIATSNVNLVSLPDREPGAFFRLGSGRAGHVYYQATPRDLPVLVGGTWEHSTVDGGYQPRAAAVGNAHILFTERADDDVNSCHWIRRIDHDGNDSRETPWQLPCHDTDQRYTSSVGLERLESGLAAMAWGERTSFGPGREFLTELTSDIQYDEGIYLALMTEDGKRGSEVIEVTDEAATVLAATPRTEASGPFPAEFYLNTAQEGDSVYVLWEDTRQTAPGIYARRVSCEL